MAIAGVREDSAGSPDRGMSQLRLRVLAVHHLHQGVYCFYAGPELQHLDIGVVRDHGGSDCLLDHGIPPIVLRPVPGRPLTRKLPLHILIPLFGEAGKGAGG